MADQGDRDFELVNNNTHPYQLLQYEINNKQLQKELEDDEVRLAGNQTTDDQLVAFIKTKLTEATAGGKKLTFEQKIDIIYAAKRKMRAELGTGGFGRDENGQFKDFQEVRRPFVAPNADAVTH